LVESSGKRAVACFQALRIPAHGARLTDLSIRNA